MSERQPYELHGRNFYLLFVAYDRRADRADYDRATLVRAYLERAEKLGEGKLWTKFVKEQSPLLQEISDALKAIYLYDQLSEQHLDLLRQKRWDDADRFAKEHKVDQIGELAWRNINPLLEEADRVLATYGIDAKQFFG